MVCSLASITSKHINWQAVVLAISSTKQLWYLVMDIFDKTTHAHTINLPSSPSAGDYVAIKDYATIFK